MVHYSTLFGISLLHYLSISQALPVDPLSTIKQKRSRGGGGGSWYEYCNNPGEIALTFDDGPFDYTSGLIDYLASEQVTATFFVNGNNYWQGENHGKIGPILQKAVDNGFEVGSHTYSHSDLMILSEDEIFDEISKTEEMIHNAIGKYPAVFRPPYGSVNEEVAYLLNSFGYTVVNWSVDIGDADTPSPSVEKEVDTVESEIKNTSNGGHIILSHDTKEQTANDFAQEVVPLLKKKGLKLVTVSQCLGVDAYKSSPASNDGGVMAKKTSKIVESTNTPEEDINATNTVEDSNTSE